MRQNEQNEPKLTKIVRTQLAKMTKMNPVNQSEPKLTKIARTQLAKMDQNVRN